MAALRRLTKEVEDLKKNGQNIGFIFSELIQDPTNDNKWVIKGQLKGPPGTPYEGGRFPIKIIFPVNYPFDPPEFKFTDPLPFHPNVYTGATSGKVCVSILQKAEWSPALNTTSIIVSVRSLLADSSAESMANQDAGHLARDNPDEFNRRVKETIVKNGQFHPEDLTPDAKGGGMNLINQHPLDILINQPLPINVTLISNDHNDGTLQNFAQLSLINNGILNYDENGERILIGTIYPIYIIPMINLKNNTPAYENVIRIEF